MNIKNFLHGKIIEHIELNEAFSIAIFVCRGYDHVVFPLSMVVNIQKKKLLRGWAKVPYGCFLERNHMVEGIPDLEKHWIT